MTKRRSVMITTDGAAGEEDGRVRGRLVAVEGEGCHRFGTGCQIVECCSGPRIQPLEY